MQDEKLTTILKLLKIKDYYNAYKLTFDELRKNPEGNVPLCCLALIAIITGSEAVSEFYVDKVGKDTFRKFIIGNLDDSLIDLLFFNQEEHKKWTNYRRPRNQNEINRFGVTAPLCTGDVLEVGCANGNLSGVIGMQADRLFGLDIDPISIELARFNMYNLQIDNCYFALGDGSQLSYADNSFDTVVLAEVLEHVTDPLPFIREAYRVCRPGGKVLISVPRGYNIPDPDHVRILTKEILANIVFDQTGQVIRWIEEVPDSWIFGAVEVKKKKSSHAQVNISDFLPIHELPKLNTNKKVSVIIPTFNRAEYLKESLDSVFSQTYLNKEIIVVDDGSTDFTEALIEPYKSKITYIKKPNGGKSSAINLGLAYATGHYVWIFDDDDIAFPKKLEIQLRKFQQDPTLDIVHTSAIYFQEIDGRKVYTGMYQSVDIPQFELPAAQLRGNYLFTPSVIVKRDIYKRTGDWDVSLTRAQDYDMWSRASIHSKVGHISLPTLYYRVHSGRRGTKSEAIMVSELKSSTEKYHRSVVKKFHKVPITSIFPACHSADSAYLVESLLERAVSMEENSLIEECLQDVSDAKQIAINSHEKYLNLSSKGIHLVNLLDKSINEWGDSKGIMDILFFVKMIKRANS